MPPGGLGVAPDLSRVTGPLSQIVSPSDQMPSTYR